MFKYIKQLAHSNEFFIRKAIGWALREYSKTNPKAVVNFVSKTKLSKLSEYEALRLIK
jgi:3-methyladenine DNA glycosylase AlkD